LEQVATEVGERRHIAGTDLQVSSDCYAQSVQAS